MRKFPLLPLPTCFFPICKQPVLLMTEGLLKGSHHSLDRFFQNRSGIGNGAEKGPAASGTDLQGFEID
jgi:hypothetical protein